MNVPSDPPDWSTVPESLRLLSLLWSLNAALERASGEMENTLGVTGPQRFLLRFVGLTPGISRARLATIVARDSSELQSDLDELVAKNLLVEQRESSGYHLTTQGAAVNAVLVGTVELAVSKALDESSPYERTSLRRILNRMLRELPTPIA